MGTRRAWTGAGRVGVAMVALAGVVGGARAAGAGDVVYRVVGVAPFPADARAGATADALDALPKPHWVDDRYWDQLAFNLLDEPERDTAVIRTWGLTRGQLAGLDIHIATAAPETGVAPISDEMVTWWKRALPDAVPMLTGAPWQGRITSGASPRPAEVRGRVNIRIGAASDFTDRPTTCAYAANGFLAHPDGSYAEWHSAEIVINPAPPAGCSIYDDPRSYTMVHELGHVLGLWHVDNPADLMFSMPGRAAGYSPRLTDHARLLYEIGHSTVYPGFSGDAPPPAKWTFSFENLAYDAVSDGWTGALRHDGAGAGTPARGLAVELQFEDAGGARLGSDGQFVWAHDAELAPDPARLQLDFGPPDGISAPAGWAKVTLLVSARAAGDDALAAVECADSDGKGETRTVGGGRQQFSACRYARSDIESAAPVPALPLAGALLLAGLLGAVGIGLRRTGAAS